MSKINIIACMDDKRAIGKDGGMPWHLPEDLKRFKRLTLHCSVVVGRKTFEAIGKPLKWRYVNIVGSGISFMGAFSSALRLGRPIWIIGGESIYKQAFDQLSINEVHLSRIAGDFKGDRFFPEFEGEVIHSEKLTDHTYEIWKPCTTARDVKKS